MKILDICKSYFSGLSDISTYKKNKGKTNVLAALKILSYFTIVVPLGFAAIYGAASLYGRVRKKLHLSSRDKIVNDQAKKTIGKKEGVDCDTLPSEKTSLNLNLFLKKAKSYAARQTCGEPGNLLVYIEKVLNDPLFQANPENFMKDWKQRRGNTEEFRMPEDQAMIFFETEILPNMKFGNSPTIKVNIEELKLKAEAFVEGKNNSFGNGKDYSSEILAYIQGVLANPSFQENPPYFMDKWKEERGHTEEFRLVEDSARMFFEQELTL
ncbi:hypothetical protein [Parachlamydia sp. AcF125]|uniref:hypothetical protein n=1 Tax=Parachlamydia sp. AcF125 TaxID=2795736 RepID=UPI001BC8F5DB|nr:hypothetical protein [Parachlamydia sp. AcF125]MBS4168513.1 hypothetical protein [Parachlamydia sp. AcF125]